jgi:hypothetical protein
MLGVGRWRSSGDRELFVALAEIAGMFVGLGALIGMHMLRTPRAL